jgi:hypothetical protein
LLYDLKYWSVRNLSSLYFNLEIDDKKYSIEFFRNECDDDNELMNEYNE